MSILDCTDFWHLVLCRTAMQPGSWKKKGAMCENWRNVKFVHYCWIIHIKLSKLITCTNISLSLFLNFIAFIIFTQLDMVIKISQTVLIETSLLVYFSFESRCGLVVFIFTGCGRVYRRIYNKIKSIILEIFVISYYYDFCYEPLFNAAFNLENCKNSDYQLNKVNCKTTWLSCEFKTQ